MGKKLVGFGDQEPSGQFYTGIWLAKISGSSANSSKSIVMQGGSTCSSSHMDDSTSWGKIGKKADGLGPKKIKGLAAANLWCFPSPINVYGKKAGNPTTGRRRAGAYYEC